MRILFLAPRFPLPATKGDQLRAWQFIQALAEEHAVTLLTYRSADVTDAAVRAAEPVCRVELVPRRGAVAGAAAAAFGRLPVQTGYYTAPPMRRRVRELAATHDMLHANTFRMLGNVPDRLPIPLVVDFIDALSLYFRDLAGWCPSVLRPFVRIEARRAAAYERALVDRAAWACAVSQHDAAAIGPGVAVLPHSIDPNTFAPPPQDAPRDGIVFTGNLRYPPNRDAALWLASAVMPKVIARVPGARLRIVGVDPPAALRRVRTPGVTVTGRVPDMAEELGRAAVAVAPMRMGCGVKTKILEAMGCATPVVATPMANRGIDARDGEEIVLAADVETMAGEVAALLTDRARAQRIGAAGRRLVAARFSWETVNRHLLAAYARLARGEPPCPG